MNRPKGRENRTRKAIKRRILSATFVLIKFKFSHFLDGNSIKKSIEKLKSKRRSRKLKSKRYINDGMFGGITHEMAR